MGRQKVGTGELACRDSRALSLLSNNCRYRLLRSPACRSSPKKIRDIGTHFNCCSRSERGRHKALLHKLIDESITFKRTCTKPILGRRPHGRVCTQKELTYSYQQDRGSLQVLSLRLFSTPQKYP